MSYNVNQKLNILLISCESPEICKRDNFPTELELYRVLVQKENDIQLTQVNVQESNIPPIGSYDGIIIWGSSSSVLNNELRMDNLRILIKLSHWKEKPLLWVCFWAQIIAQAFNGQIEKTEPWEIWFKQISLTEDGILDPLFYGREKEMNVISAHEDNILPSPEIWRILANNSYSNCQSFAIGRWTRWVQFHPEYTTKVLNQLESILELPISQSQEHDGILVVENFIKNFIHKKKYNP